MGSGHETSSRMTGGRSGMTGDGHQSTGAYGLTESHQQGQGHRGVGMGDNFGSSSAHGESNLDRERASAAGMHDNKPNPAYSELFLLSLYPAGYIC